MKKMNNVVITRNKKILLFSIIITYLILLIPYTVVSNAGEVGIVDSSQRIDVNSLPADIQDLLTIKKDSYNILIIVYPIADLTKLNGQNVKERKLILSNNMQEDGSFVRINNMTADIYVSSYAIVNQTFDKLIIGDTKTAVLNNIIETINYYKLNSIISISKIDYLVGGLFVVLIITFLFNNKMLGLWNIPAIIVFYSFQFFITNMIGMANGLKIYPIYLLFGLFFVPAMYIVSMLHKYEKTEEGQLKILKLRIRNRQIFSKIKAKFGM